MEDEKIIEMFFNRDSSALRETEQKYNRYMYSVTHRILGNHEDAEECVNDALLSAWNSIPPQRPVVLRSFLARLARNHAINRRKASTADKRGGGEAALAIEELEECIPGGSETEAEVMAEALDQAIRSFVRELPAREGNLFTRRYFFAESVKEIAERYDLKQNNVSVILNRTRKKLREYLTKNRLL
jgi:RNA polymerase sigma factor, sigma-70 family